MKSIIFNQHQVNYALNNEEGMFRVVVKPRKIHDVTIRELMGDYDYAHITRYINNPFTYATFYLKSRNGAYQRNIKSPYQVGQEIFVKETYEEWDDGLVYKADNQPCNIVCKWKSSVHMKQEHSRLTLQIKEIGVERLNEISEEDCWKEGLQNKDFSSEELDAITPFKIINRFKQLWNSTHKKPEEKWEANPFVFVYQFELIK